MICGTGPNTRTIETATGFAVLDLSLKPKQSSTVMISYSGITDFANFACRFWLEGAGLVNE
jgi:DNA polymerase V